MNILVVSHGDLAKGMYDAATMIVGKHENFDYLSFEPGVSLEDFTNKLRAKIMEATANGQLTLVMADLMGGTPSNALATLLGEGMEMHVLAGFNLSMLLEALLDANSVDDIDTFATDLVEHGKESVLDLSKMLLED